MRYFLILNCLTCLLCVCCQNDKADTVYSETNTNIYHYNLECNNLNYRNPIYLYTEDEALQKGFKSCDYCK